ncbi:MAG: hypothetical protein KBA81_02050 [Rhabdochlamydiaceae bacterium]|nr:hypothetical protein [Rhabdochlamydiaceae bacterium]
MSIRPVSPDVTSNAALQLQDDGVDIEKMMQDALDELDGYEEPHAEPSPNPNSSFVGPKQWGVADTKTDLLQGQLIEMMLSGNLDGVLPFYQNLLEKASDPNEREMLEWNVELLQAMKEENLDKVNHLKSHMPEAMNSNLEKLKKMDENPQLLIPFIEEALRVAVGLFKAEESKVEDDVRNTMQQTLQDADKVPNFKQEVKDRIEHALQFIGIDVEKYIHLEQLKLLSTLALGEIYVFSEYQDLNLIPEVAKRMVERGDDLFHLIPLLEKIEEPRKSEIVAVYRKFVLEKLDKS